MEQLPMIQSKFAGMLATLSEATVRFIREHRTTDVHTLALQANRPSGVDLPAALIQIAGWQVAREKVPSWAAIEAIRYPRHLSMEQCSSEATARYKSAVIDAFARRESRPLLAFADLTGGFGIDCSFLAARFQQAAYVERQEALCALAAHNFGLLGLGRVEVCCDDALRHLQAMPPADWIFIDPARRDGHGGRTVAIGDCEPDVAQLEDLLLTKAHHVLVKLSPMLDLSQALKELKQVEEAHVVAVAGECKELLLVLGQAGKELDPQDIPIHCVNLDKAGDDASPFRFTRREEQACEAEYAPVVGQYLYEPNASLLKAGAFRTLAARYRLKKLHPNSHLYTSDEPVEAFPGRAFRVEGSCRPDKREVKELLGREVRKANLTVRNFPATVADLRRRLKLSEGGECYLFATTLADGGHRLVLGRKCGR